VLFIRCSLSTLQRWHIISDYTNSVNSHTLYPVKNTVKALPRLGFVYSYSFKSVYLKYYSVLNTCFQYLENKKIPAM